VCNTQDCEILADGAATATTTTPTTTQFADRLKGDLPQGVGTIINVIDAMPIKRLCMGEIWTDQNSLCFDGTKTSHIAYHIYDNQIGSYTTGAMVNQILAGHWVAKEAGIDCAEIVNYDKFVTNQCATVHGNPVMIMKADRDKFGEYTEQVRNCPAVYFKVVPSCE
jgi:hypothetical protein